MRPRILSMLVIAIALLLGVGAIAVVLLGDGSSHRGSDTATTGEDRAGDDTNPNRTGCAATAEEIPGSRVPIGIAAGKLGFLMLRTSTACGTVWARVEGVPEQSVLSLSLTRQDDGKVVSDTFPHGVAQGIAFTNQLVARGCFVAEASFGTGRTRLSDTRTPCLTQHTDSTGTREPPSGPPPSARTWREQEGTRGAATFENPYDTSDPGVKVAPYAWVRVSCRLYAPQIQSANPDGYWYRIASRPWSNHYYAVANTFWNGDVPGRLPYTHDTDWRVATC